MYIVDALEAGVLSTPSDDRVHAVKLTLHGREALCGAGRIAGGVLGRFADIAPETVPGAQVCLACFAVALPQPRLAG